MKAVICYQASKGDSCSLRKVSMLCLVGQSCLTLCDPMDGSPPGTSVHGDSPGQNTGVGCSALLQGIFSTQGSNMHFLHLTCIGRWVLYYYCHLGSPSLQLGVTNWLGYGPWVISWTSSRPGPFKKKTHSQMPIFHPLLSPSCWIERTLYLEDGRAIRQKGAWVDDQLE